ncbi:MAG: acyl-CoA thioesterase [Oceanococcaceae bacterium]
MIEHSIEIEIPFHDVDMMQVTWHGHYVRYLELARCALLDRIGFGYKEMAASGYAWPIVDMRLRYVRPCRFGDRVEVQVRVVEYEYRLKLDYLIRDAQSGQRLTKASTVQVALDTSNGELIYPSPQVLVEPMERACAA